MLLRAAFAVRQAGGRDLTSGVHLSRFLLAAPHAEGEAPVSTCSHQSAWSQQSSSVLHTQSWAALPSAAQPALLHLQGHGRARHISEGALTTLQRKTSISATARALLVDTLDMVRNLEKVGLTRQQAELLTEHLTEVLCDHKEKLSQNFVSRAMLEKTLLELDAQQAGFKSEISKAQDLHVTTLNRESERLANDVAKVRSEIRYEVDKLTASQRLDLNLEKGRMRDELQALRDKSNELEIKIDKEINALKAAVELTKNETIKYSLGLMFGLLTIGLGVIRLLI
mmetsp:Transcript_14044/g.42391  ORF Transcript_14044/g.42391 Transcript_14044/m.42391 type:complete len:283 (+) Transcript_14044:227-1075(+)|eukprot:CAMPEP_0206136278 /NCGR_PEP_ID=MMETSP1473-20131121/1517_1 /ASSEMBLY_ACC=CAM_ASM_001109 /TAXON_ID=1461547 /ORGANISM="Stichococcus sp, Strain RCC1054" /LENGTH=282 /DNA_ID=CAMNT_0053528689 /DNA_START=217 /DNA_END=1065 /DNA_ORIENTATION=+